MTPKEQPIVCNESVKEFFSEYPAGQHSDILYDIISICALDEKSGISDNRKYSLVSFLERCNKLLCEIQPIEAAFKTHQIPQRNHTLKESKPLLCQPFFEREPTTEHIEKRSNYDQYIDHKLIKLLSGKQPQPSDILARFFVRYGLKETLDLLASLKSETSDRNEAVKFKRDLKHLLFALYTIFKEETLQSCIKKKGDCHVK
ncbi:hypothetical protein QT327_16735 [Olivibacter sp. 47]|jgi:hypothetical protein|uniref:hypothetical protein n=1 Tax=Olivibacter sp. 47 TaxID=3056486 RepID=UPI0025A3C372|nr:hypothetical protein [Olivibacter sp. 47]MDM8175974.1 hypothetical protein [Olivibacter sp. 47]